MSENTQTNNNILNGTGGDYSFADLFIQSAEEKAAEYNEYIPHAVINDFLNEVAKHKKIWERRREL